MREITVKLYQFDELNEDAKDKAREWCRDDHGMKGQWAWDQVQEDAENVGLKIMRLHDHRPNEGKFIGTALETLESILKEHGNNCETHKTAQRYEKSLREAIEAVNQDEPEACDKLEDVETELLADLLEDYRIMYNENIEYAYSDEAIDEDMRANEWEFTEMGKRA